MCWFLISWCCEGGKGRPSDVAVEARVSSLIDAADLQVCLDEALDSLVEGAESGDDEERRGGDICRPGIDGADLVGRGVDRFQVSCHRVLHQPHVGERPGHSLDIAGVAAVGGAVLYRDVRAAA